MPHPLQWPWFAGITDVDIKDGLWLSSTAGRVINNLFVSPSIFTRESCFNLELIASSSAHHWWLFGDKFLATQSINHRCCSRSAGEMNADLPRAVIQRHWEYVCFNYSFSIMPWFDWSILIRRNFCVFVPRLWVCNTWTTAPCETEDRGTTAAVVCLILLLLLAGVLVFLLWRYTLMH